MPAGDQDLLNSRDVSRETLDRLRCFADLLEKWNPAINLVSRSSLKDLWRRHILDSVQVFDIASDAAGGRATGLGGSWLDIGTGGGFPGLVVAILARDEAPDLNVTLVESDARKAAFLTTVIRETGLTVEVRISRIEAMPPQCADIVSARALAPLGQLLGYTAPHLMPTGRAIFSKGAGYAAEVTQALERWRFDLQKHQSITDPAGVILTIESLHHV